MPLTPGHLFVQDWLRQKRDEGELLTLEDSQKAMKEGWRQWKMKQNPYSRRGREDLDLDRRQALELEVARLDDVYNRVLDRYGPNDPLTRVAEKRLARAERMASRFENPRMPIGYYAGMSPGTPVVVREYIRRLPKRPVKSRETTYKRLKKKVAKVVENEWTRAGASALEEEIKHGGGPVSGGRMKSNPYPYPHALWDTDLSPNRTIVLNPDEVKPPPPPPPPWTDIAYSTMRTGRHPGFGGGFQNPERQNLTNVLFASVALVVVSILGGIHKRR